MQTASALFKVSVLYGDLQMGRLTKNHDANTAQLKELTTTPPMSPERHAALLRKRTAQRRLLEDRAYQRLRSDLF